MYLIMIKIMKKDIKKILIIRNDKIGDLVTSTPVFRELREYFPKTEIIFVSSKSARQIVEKNKNINRILIADYPPTNYRNLLSYLKIVKILKKEKIDIGIDLRGSIFNIILLYLLKVKYKVGYYNRYFSKFLLDYAYEKDRVNTHACFQRVDLINKALGLNSRNYKLDIAVDKEDRYKAIVLINKFKLKKFICIVPDASLKYKQWSLERFNKIIKYIVKNYPKYQIILVGADRKKMNWLKKRNLKIIVPEELLDLRVSYLLFKKSSLVIAHDGGPMHLAEAANSNLIAFIPKHLAPAYYWPQGKNFKIISKDVKNISVEDVREAIDGFLSQR